jgi:hypothetical protein
MVLLYVLLYIGDRISIAALKKATWWPETQESIQCICVKYMIYYVYKNEKLSKNWGLKVINN